VNFTDPDKFLAHWHGPEVFEPGLERIKPFFDIWKKNFNSNLKIITIAGTNGKGETALYLETILRKLNLKTALWTSPHLNSVCERVRLNSISVEKKQMLKCFETVSNLARKNNVQLSYYEFVFASFLQASLEFSPDYLILEVGMGGRLDAVNLFDAHIVAIPSISRDHMSFLGQSYREILNEKLGVIRPGIPVMTCFRNSYLRQLASDVCAKKQAIYSDIVQGDKKIAQLNYHLRNKKLAFNVAKFLAPSLQYFDLDEISDSMPARAEKVTLNDKTFIFVGAHNTDGMRQLVERKNEYDCVALGLSQRTDDEMIAILKMARLLTKNLVLFDFDHPRAMKFFEKRSFVQNLLGSEVQFKILGSDEFVENLPGKSILVAGSYYFLGSVRSYYPGLQSTI
jgi:dihydrofolate synthase/folylpolyglutamate synthase